MKRFPFRWAGLATHYSTTLQYDVTRIGGYWAIIRIFSKIRCSYKNYSMATMLGSQLWIYANFMAAGEICSCLWSSSFCKMWSGIDSIPSQILYVWLRVKQLEGFIQSLSRNWQLLVVSISCSLAVASCFLPCRKMCGLDFCHRGVETLLSVSGRSLLKGAMWHMIASPI